MFEDLWKELHKMELVDHSIADIEESEVFKYSPYKGLTVDQKVALDSIMSAIRSGLNDAKPIVVEGMPGTGKTILAIYLLKMLKDDPDFKDLNVRIIEPVTSLRKTLRKSLKNVSGLSPKDVIAPTDLVKPALGHKPGEGKCFDIALVDEAHKLKCRKNLGTQFGNFDRTTRELGLPEGVTQMDWVIAQAKLVADKSNYYDRNGYATASQEELDQYIRNIYYVLLTRGILGTHVYAVNPKMREYLRRFVSRNA